MNEKRTCINIPIAHVKQVQDRFKTELNILQVSEEECAELMQAISKTIRVAQGTARGLTMRQARDYVGEELTDVTVCIMALCEIFNITQKEIDEHVRFKAERDGFDMSDYDD